MSLPSRRTSLQDVWPRKSCQSHSAESYPLNKTTKIYLLERENDGYFEEAESLRQDVSKILSEDVNKKHQNNLTTGERKSTK